MTARKAPTAVPVAQVLPTAWGPEWDVPGFQWACTVCPFIAYSEDAARGHVARVGWLGRGERHSLSLVAIDSSPHAAEHMTESDPACEQCRALYDDAEHWRKGTARYSPVGVCGYCGGVWLDSENRCASEDAGR